MYHSALSKRYEKHQDKTLFDEEDSWWINQEPMWHEGHVFVLMDGGTAQEFYDYIYDKGNWILDWDRSNYESN